MSEIMNLTIMVEVSVSVEVDELDTHRLSDAGQEYLSTHIEDKLSEEISELESEFDTAANDKFGLYFDGSYDRTLVYDDGEDVPEFEVSFDISTSQF